MPLEIDLGDEEAPESSQTDGGEVYKSSGTIESTAERHTACYKSHDSSNKNG